jgi:hypothetical protein
MLDSESLNIISISGLLNGVPRIVQRIQILPVIHQHFLKYMIKNRYIFATGVLRFCI